MKVQCEKCIHKDVCRFESDYKATIREYEDLDKQIHIFKLKIECHEYKNEFSLKRGGRMTCKEKIDEIEKKLNDEHEVKIGRIRRIVEDAEDKSISLEKVKKAREEINELDGEHLTIYDGTSKIGSGKYVYIEDVLEILDKLIAESEE